MIFARRAIQCRLEELRTAIEPNTVSNLVKRLNRPGKDRLAAMWEVVILHSLAPLGQIVNEAPLSSGRCPDIAFSNSLASFVADITSVSDEGLDEKNPHRELSNNLEKLKKRLGLKAWGMDLRIDAKQEKTARGTKTSLRLPDKKRLSEFVREKIEPELRQQITEGRSVLHLALEDEKASFKITIDPKSRYSTYSFAAYDLPTIKDSNPLYNALRLKAGQLKGAGGLVGVIVGDGDTRTLADRQNHWSTVNAREIADEFLRQNSSISFVLMLSVREERASPFGLSHINKPDLKLHPELVFSKTQAVPDALKRLFYQMMENMPKPISMPVNAALRAQEAQYDLGHHGGYVLSNNRIKISAREVMELLAGRRTVSDMNSMRKWSLSTDEGQKGMQNPFERWLIEGRLPSSITVLKTDENDLDDWIEIEIGDADPAISPFR